MSCSEPSQKPYRRAASTNPAICWRGRSTTRRRNQFPDLGEEPSYPRRADEEKRDVLARRVPERMPHVTRDVYNVTRAMAVPGLAVKFLDSAVEDAHRLAIRVTVERDDDTGGNARPEYTVLAPDIPGGDESDPWSHDICQIPEIGL